MTLYERVTGLTDTSTLVYGTRQRGQSFTVGVTGPNYTHRVTSVEIYANRDGSPGTLYCYIRRIQDELPYGDVVSYGTINANTFSTVAYNWYAIPIVLPCVMYKATKYAFALKAPNGNEDNAVRYAWDQWQNRYPNPYGTRIFFDVPGGWWYSGGLGNLRFKINGYNTTRCECPGKQPWEIDMTSYCNITESGDIGNNDLTFKGAGQCIINATITARNMGIPPANSILKLGTSGLINLRG